MKNLILAAALAWLVAACQPAEVDPAFDEDAASGRLAEYEAARANGDFEIAEAHGNTLRQRHGETAAATQVRRTLDEVRAGAEEMRETRRLRGLWEYQSIPTGNGTQHTAAIYSRVPSAPEGEVAPTPDARLILRRHPDWGESAYLVLTQRKLECRPPCALQIRFDEGEPQRFAGEPADTGTGPALFIKDRDRFLAALREARQVRIEIPSSGALVPMFEFEVGGFSPAWHLAD